MLWDEEELEKGFIEVFIYTAVHRLDPTTMKLLDLSIPLISTNERLLTLLHIRPASSLPQLASRKANTP